MDAEKADYPIALMARVLGLTRQGYYAWLKRKDVRQERAEGRRAFDRHVSEVFAKSRQTYGAARIRLALAREGIRVCERTVAASMRRQQLVALSSRSFVKPGRKAGAEEKVVDLCGRCWDQGGLDLVWVTDFTYLRCGCFASLRTRPVPSRKLGQFRHENQATCGGLGDVESPLAGHFSCR